MRLHIEIIDNDNANRALSVHETISNAKSIIREGESVTFDVDDGKPIVLEKVDITPPDPNVVILGDTLIIGDGLG